ncbi:hypothetical protein STAS_33767 [Striga asiatica]|uniref:C2 NT-type domain-containing protein n=1 Tax=Striga asiatica TaxID=4170 RepID=A0A5A7RFV0_STRAF|nr:hypothetical protein STAS_33767 [Striga asiatica]
MVLGLRSKHRKDASFRVSYTVHVNEISPWPPSEYLRSVRSILLQWENGNQNSGTFLATARDSKLVFNETFKLPLVLHRDKRANDRFQKNYLEFSLFMPYKNKAKGHSLGTAVVNFADYGLIEHLISINAAVNMKKGGSVQPVLSISLEPVEKEKNSSSSSPNLGLSKEPSLDGSEIASFTDDDDDDDDSSQSSRTVGSSAFEVATSSLLQNEKNVYGDSKFEPEPNTNVQTPFNGVPPFDAEDYRVKDNVSFLKHSFERSMTSSAKKNSSTPFIRSYPSSIIPRDINGKPDAFVANLLHENVHDILIENDQQSAKGKSIEEFQPEVILADSDGKDVDNARETESPLEKSEFSDGKDEYKMRIMMLEEELRETAAIEIGLYSVVAEHASSVNKVHVPARRLSRFYSKACKTEIKARRQSAARATISGLILVAKACGNDVARLTFWLSNSIMLRAIVSEVTAEYQNSDIDLDDVSAFITALANIESWLFSRIVESVWWQTFTPHMHPAAAKIRDVDSISSTKKMCGRRNSLGSHNDQGNFSTELWKKAFKDACERLCPIRAAGHECGCLSVLVRLVMEQLVDRLDTAMFNAILRESAEDMPTDPLSDPITEAKVLPIPPGKSSFGAGVELKNSIGNWSRWLSDLFGLEEDTTGNNDIVSNGKKSKPSKAFRLLHALSDLMMLPFKMLADNSTRREVCPILGPTIIRRVLNNHVPDEFCPDTVPQDIIDALNSEEVLDEENSGDLVASFPYSASPSTYLPPSAALLTCVGEVGSQVLSSSRLSSIKKSYTSDDELDELDSPYTSIIPDSLRTSDLTKLGLLPEENGDSRNIVRYQLLKGIWKDDE